MEIQSVGSFGTGPPPAGPQGNAPPPAAQPAVQVPVAPAAPAPERPKLEQVVKEFKQLVKPVVSNNLDFSVDQSTGKAIVRITDRETGELIRQIPSEEMMEIARSLDRMQGLLLRQKA